MVVALGAVVLGSLFFSYTTITKYKKVFMLIVILALAILGLLYDPIKAQVVNQSYTDLYRIFNELNVFRNYGWNVQPNVQGSSLITTNYDAVIVAKIYMYSVATLTTNNHVLVFINALLTYGAMAWGLIFLGKKYQISNFVIVSSFVFFVLINDYSRVIANIRMPLAISLFFLVWSYEIYRGKASIWLYFAYFLICLLHNAMFLFLFMKLLVTIVPRKATNILMVVMLFSSVLLTPLISLLSKLNNFGAIVSGVLEKVLLYSETDGLVGVTALLAQKQMVFIDFVRIVYFILLIYCVDKNLHSNYEKGKQTDNLMIDEIVRFSKILVAFSLGSIWSFNVFNRSVLIMVALMPIFLVILSKKNAVHVLSIRHIDFLVLANWSIVIISLLYYFYGHTYQQLGL